MGRSPCCVKENVNRGAWTAMEDRTLSEYVTIHGEGKWRDLPKRAGLNRCGKSCRLRWLNYLRPDIKRGNITDDEEELIIRLHKLLGNRWSLIAGRLPGRTDNEIKNHWNTNLCKKTAKDDGRPEPTNKFKPNEPFPTQCYNDRKLQLSSTTTMAPPPPPTLFRTKATRCTTAVINPPQMTSNSGDWSDYEPRSSIFRDFSIDNLKGIGDNSRETMVPDLSNDLNMGGTWLAEILNLDLSSVLDEFGLETGILNSELSLATSNLADPAMAFKENFPEI